MARGEKQSFGEQAARFSLYAPFAVLIIGLLTAGNRNQPGVAMTMLVINIVVVFAGLGLGIAALILMSRYGRQRILGRAAVGVALNGLLVAVVVMALVPVVVTGRMKSRMAGHWSMHVTANPVASTIELVLNQDGTCHFDSVNGGKATASLDGDWTMNRYRILGVRIQKVSYGDASAVGQSFGLGRVQLVDDQQMILQTDKGQEIYSRVP
jgi:hypothetical protein